MKTSNPDGKNLEKIFQKKLKKLLTTDKVIC